MKEPESKTDDIPRLRVIRNDIGLCMSYRANQKKLVVYLVTFLLSLAIASGVGGILGRSGVLGSGQLLLLPTLMVVFLVGWIKLALMASRPEVILTTETLSLRYRPMPRRGGFQMALKEIRGFRVQQANLGQGSADWEVIIDARTGPSRTLVSNISEGQAALRICEEAQRFFQENT